MGNCRQVLQYIGAEKQPLYAHGSTERVTVYVLVMPRRLLEAVSH